MTLAQALISIILIALIIFAERLFPFVVFSNKTPGKLIHFFEKYIPPFVMLGLLIYSLRSIRFTELAMWLPHLTGVLFTISSYLIKKNTMISIFGGTIVYMILIRVL